MNYKTRKIAMLGVLAALAYLSVVLINIPVVSVDFLKYEPKDVVIALGGLMFGPLEAGAALRSRLPSGDGHHQFHGHHRPA